MTPSPAVLHFLPCSPAAKSIPGTGGNLARVHRNAPPPGRGSFFFTEQPQQFGAQITDAGRERVLPPSGAGAATDSGVDSFSRESRPFPFPEVDNHSHHDLLVSTTVRGGRSAMQEGLSQW